MTTSTTTPSTFEQSYHAVHLTQNDARAVLWHVLVEYLAPYVPNDARVLELGAGYCYWINGVRAAFKVAVDLWRDFPNHASPDVQPILHDLSKGLDLFAPQSFDVVLASNLLEHFEPALTERLVGETFRLLRPQGRFIVIQPNFRYAYRRYFDDYTHRAIFTDVSLPNLMRAQGFAIEKVESRFTPYSLRDSRVKIGPTLIRCYLRSPIKPFAGQMLIVGQRP
jgi:SAM-dependent methyltransferase